MKVQENLSDEKRLERLLLIFNQLMSDTYQTILEGGGEEPLYQARKNKDVKHRIVFTRDYISSALHEMSHWCVAGEERRKLDDYGYWYAPDGRSEAQQIEFETVEVKPQAIEWILSRACGVPFRVSVDNLESGAVPSNSFKKAIVEQVQYYCSNGLPNRADSLAKAFFESFFVSIFDPLDIRFKSQVYKHKNTACYLKASTFLSADSYSIESLECFNITGIE